MYINIKLNEISLINSCSYRISILYNLFTELTMTHLITVINLILLLRFFFGGGKEIH